MPLYVPILFLGWGILLAVVNRKAFKDPDGELRRMAAKRASGRVVRFLGGTGDPEEEYQTLRKGRWVYPVGAVLYAAVVAWMFVVAVRS
ncbi:MAG: hypothetical protein ABL953_08265 [Ilumatobacteraceae bacterium]